MDKKAPSDTSPQPAESSSVNGHVLGGEGSSRTGSEMEAVLNGGTHLAPSSEQQGDPHLKQEPVKITDAPPKPPSPSTAISKANGAPPQGEQKAKSPHSSAISNGVEEVANSVKADVKSDAKVIPSEPTIESFPSKEVKNDKTNGEVPDGVPLTNEKSGLEIHVKDATLEKIKMDTANASSSPCAASKDPQIGGSGDSGAPFVPTSLDKRKEEKNELSHISENSKHQITPDSHKREDHSESMSTVNSTASKGGDTSKHGSKDEALSQKGSFQPSGDDTQSAFSCESKVMPSLKEDSVSKPEEKSKVTPSLKEDSLGKTDKDSKELTQDKEVGKGQTQSDVLKEIKVEKLEDLGSAKKEKLEESKTSDNKEKSKVDSIIEGKDKSPEQPPSKDEVAKSTDKAKEGSDLTTGAKSISEAKVLPPIKEDIKKNDLDSAGYNEEDDSKKGDGKIKESKEMMEKLDLGGVAKATSDATHHSENDAVKEKQTDQPPEEKGEKSLIAVKSSPAPEANSLESQPDATAPVHSNEKESKDENKVQEAKEILSKQAENIKPIEILEVKEIDKKEKSKTSDTQVDLQEQDGLSEKTPDDSDVGNVTSNQTATEDTADADIKVDGKEITEVDSEKDGSDKKETLSHQAPLSSDDTITLVKETQLADAEEKGESPDKTSEGKETPTPAAKEENETKPSKVKEIKINETTPNEAMASASKERTDDGARSPTKTPGSPRKPRSRRSSSPRKSPTRQPSPTKPPETKKLPPIKTPVGHAPMPNLKNVKSKIGSFDNIKYKPKTSEDKTKKVVTKKLEWKAVPKVGSLDNARYKPGGGDKKIHSVKVDFKERAQSRLGVDRQQQSKSPETGDEEAESESGTRKRGRSKSPHAHTKSKSLDVSGLIDGATDTGSETEETQSEAKPSSSRLKDKSKSMDAPSAVLSTEKEISPDPPAKEPDTQGAKLAAAQEDENRNKEGGQETPK